MTEELRNDDDRRNSSFSSEKIRLERMWAGENDRRKGGERRRDMFTRKYTLILTEWEKFTQHIQSALNACNDNQDFAAIHYHYQKAEELARDIQTIQQFLKSLLPPLKSEEGSREAQIEEANESLAVQKRRALVWFLARSQDTLMVQLMNACRPWLREEHLKQGLSLNP